MRVQTEGNCYDMPVPNEEVIRVLLAQNPWWQGRVLTRLPTWKRAAFGKFHRWMFDPPAPMAVELAGTRQVGKTTIMRQSIASLLETGVAPANILHARFDVTVLSELGLDSVIQAWEERFPERKGTAYLFLDEVRDAPDWGTWIKVAVDLRENWRIAFSGSAMSLGTADSSAGVGRWRTVRLPTLSFHEYLELRKVALPPTPPLGSLGDLFEWSGQDLHVAREAAQECQGHFQEYLLRGGYPRAVLTDSADEAQAIVRDDIVDRILRSDMTRYFGVRRVRDLELVFLYLCRQRGGILDLPTLCSNTGMNRAQAERFIGLFEAAHLVHRLLPHGYGKEVLRGRSKIHLADSCLASAMTFGDDSMLERPAELGMVVESVVHKHLFAHRVPRPVPCTYWRDGRGNEVDLVLEEGRGPVPVEVKYRSGPVDARDLKGLVEMCRQKEIKRGYVVTKSPEDRGLLEFPARGRGRPKGPAPEVMRIPAALLCLCLGAAEAGRSPGG